MEHRKRSIMQHKAELSTLLRIVIAGGKSKKLRNNGNDVLNLTKALASEAIESLKICDHAIEKTPRLKHTENLLDV